ncbi:hypothetical protein SDB_00816 [Shigella dysenteriae CDC 74-1112]|nr:hypothetical protein SDB_00816 [Shigella dysenteriae CDC 74-1112]
MLRTGIEGWTENDILRYCRLSSGRNYATELERQLGITLERIDEKNPDGIGTHLRYRFSCRGDVLKVITHGFAPIFPDICYHLTHYKPAAADIPVASDNPAHYADAIRYNARTPLQGSLLPLTRLVWA